MSTHIVVQGRNGGQTDRDGIASEGSGLELDIGTAIYFGRAALGAFSLFQFSPRAYRACLKEILLNVERLVKDVALRSDLKHVWSETHFSRGQGGIFKFVDPC